MSAKLITGLAPICAAIALLFGSGIALAEPLGYNLSKAIGNHEVDVDIHKSFLQNGPTLTLSDQQLRQDFCNTEFQVWQPINDQHNMSVDSVGWLEGCDNAALNAVQQGWAN